jgi:branched-subunit amino acid aminotransferase/4-amino-4-deoxychorismate lyase
MQTWLWNGSEFSPATSVPLTDRGFRYGMALFETVRVWNGRIEFWQPHKHRLLASCAERGFPLDEKVFWRASEVLETAGVNGIARIYVTAGDGAPSAPVLAPRVFLLLENRDVEKEESWEIGFHEETYRPPFGGLKTANYWFNADALAAAKSRKLDEVLLFNDFAELVSACCANVFIVHGERILTPSRGSGCRLGIVREWVLKRRKVEERRIRHEDVVNADEIFLTNSWLGVMPIATLEGRPLGPRKVGPKLAGEIARMRELN